MLDTPLNEKLKTTKAHLKKLEELGVRTVRDLLLYLPRRYTDSIAIRPIASVKVGELVTVRGTLRSISTRSALRKRMGITTALISDESGSIEATWFNQAYLANMFAKGEEVMLTGKPRFKKGKSEIVFSAATMEKTNKEAIHGGRIVPIYPETELDSTSEKKRRLSSKWLREKLFALMPATSEFEDPLPEDVRAAHQLLEYGEALCGAHFPESAAVLEKAKHRLAFQELFFLQLAALHRRALDRTKIKNPKIIPLDWESVKKFTAGLPWQLTNAQRRALFEIITDLTKPHPMSRLLEGDTGAGKTVVAAAALYRAIQAGFQGCLLAPTEILARQHFNSLSELLHPHGIKPTLLIGALGEKEKKDIKKRICDGSISFLVGTHALLSDGVRFANLGLAVVDEQHRFGVRQREQLKEFGPHILHMTATPIPRTLALTLYGEHDLSILDEKPAGREKIVTRIVPEEKRAEAYAWIRDKIGEGRQIFFVFPLINESEKIDLKAATQEYARLEDVFTGRRVGLLHGQLTSEEKQNVMADFSRGAIDVLVSTSVIEVGVDVPNATIMVIESAERFGLAQLHQFRGRVGRGRDKSYCLLFPSGLTPLVRRRLEAVVKYDCGFRLAEIDLELRGAGEVYGTAQSGLPDLRMASLSDAKTIHEAREAAEKLIGEDPLLEKNPILKKLVQKELARIAMDF